MTDFRKWFPTALAAAFALVSSVSAFAAPAPNGKTQLNEQPDVVFVPSLNLATGNSTQAQTVEITITDGAANKVDGSVFVVFDGDVQCTCVAPANLQLAANKFQADAQTQVSNLANLIGPEIALGLNANPETVNFAPATITGSARSKMAGNTNSATNVSPPNLIAFGATNSGKTAFNVTSGDYNTAAGDINGAAKLKPGTTAAALLAT